MVAFSKIPQTLDEVRAALFPGRSGNETFTYYDESTTIDDICKRVLSDTKGQKPNDPSSIASAFGGYLYGGPDSNDFTDLDGNIDWDALHEAEAAFREIGVKRFLKLHEGKQILCFSYADESGEGLLEHGNIFANVEHEQISHH